VSKERFDAFSAGYGFGRDGNPNITRAGVQFVKRAY